MSEKVFSIGQKTRGIIFIMVPTLGGGILRYYGYINSEKIADTVLQISVPLIGFVLTTVAIIGSVLGTSLVQRLQQTNAYYSLLTNLLWLVYALFVGVVFGVILRIVKHECLSNIVIDIFAIMLISVIFVLLWYAVSRFVRMMRAIKE